MCERVCVCAHSSICRLCIKYDFGYAWTRVDPHFFVVALLWIQILCNLTGLFIDFVRDEILSIYLIAFDSGYNCMSVSVCVWCPQSIKMHSVLRNRLPDTSIIIWVSHFMICVFSLKYHQKKTVTKLNISVENWCITWTLNNLVRCEAEMKINGQSFWWYEQTCLGAYSEISMENRSLRFIYHAHIKFGIFAVSSIIMFKLCLSWGSVHSTYLHQGFQ